MHEGALIQGGCMWSLIEIILLTMLAILVFRWNIHDVQAHFQLSFLRSFNFYKFSLTISYPIEHAQLEITETKTKKKKKKQKKNNSNRKRKK